MVPAMSSSLRHRIPGRMTVEEFLAWADDDSPEKWQLMDGEPFAMAPASATHGRIQARIAALLDRALETQGRPCFTVTEPAVSPRIRSAINLRVPDLAVTCTPIAPGQVTLPNPVLIVEILSPSNEPTTWDNVWAYTTIPSVREILVVHSIRMRVELLRRQVDGSWPEEPLLIEGDGTLTLEGAGLTCALPELYRGTHLPG